MCGLAESLCGYARDLPEVQRHALYEMLLWAMEPLDRFHYIRSSDLLSPDEEVVLGLLEKELRKR